MTVNSGPTVYDWMLQDWIDENFEDGSKGDGTVSSNIAAYFTQCYGGNFLENFNNAIGDTAGGGAFDSVTFTIGLSDGIVESGTIQMPDGSELSTWTIPIPEDSLEYYPGDAHSNQIIELRNFSTDPVFFELLILGTGDIAKVPEPTALIVLGAGAMALLRRRRRRRRA